MRHFLECFDGHFDNHAQVVSDMAAGLTPREGGGHEHIHCVLRPITMPDEPNGSHMLASYYFNGHPEAVFRERLYSIEPERCDPQFGVCLKMRIFKLRDAMQAQLRSGVSVKDVSWLGCSDLADDLAIEGAEVFWRWCGERFEGEMRTESVVINSERTGRPLRVRDDVALWEGGLWVNDRGTDAETGAYVYGNIHDVPYKMQRVSEDHWTASGSEPPEDWVQVPLRMQS